MGEIIIHIFNIQIKPLIFFCFWVSFPMITIIILIIIDLFKYGLKRLSYYKEQERILASIALLIFGPVSCIALIRVFRNTKIKERKKIRKDAFWWQLKEFGGWK